MKRKIICSLIGLSLIGSLTGCGKEQKSKINLDKGKFSIICNSKEEDINGIKQNTESTYNFNEEQYTINYSVVTTQKFKDKSVYNEYKKAQEETVKNSSEDIIYELLSDDKNKSLIFTMAVTKIDLSNAKDEEKDTVKASTIFKRAEEDGTTKCRVEGINKSKLK
ncbi:MAG: hypothetical protein IKJ43_02310 [Bacilli bacterium]|nr:hypothetical protein [Bacilli bacterium]